MPIFLGLIIAPAAVLLLWYAMPLFKTVMIEVTTSWGEAVGLSGFALLLADALPLIVPTVCVSGIVASFIYLARSSRVG